MGNDVVESTGTCSKCKVETEELGNGLCAKCWDLQVAPVVRVPHNRINIVRPVTLRSNGEYLARYNKNKRYKRLRLKGSTGL